MRDILVRILLVGLLVAVATGRAMAADGTAVSFAPLVSVAVEVLTPVVLAVATAALGVLTAWLQRRARVAGLEIDDAQRAVVDQGLQKALGAGIAKVGGAAEQLAQHGKLSLDIRNEVVREATVYAIAHVPDALASFGITARNADRLAEMIEARLGMLAVSQATRPATLATATATEPPANPAGAS